MSCTIRLACAGDGVEHVEKQLEASLDPERAFVAIAIDASTVHVFEHEVGLPARRRRR